MFSSIGQFDEIVLATEYAIDMYTIWIKRTYWDILGVSISSQKNLFFSEKNQNSKAKKNQTMLEETRAHRAHYPHANGKPLKLLTNRARCALNKKILNLLNKESFSRESSARASL